MSRKNKLSERGVKPEATPQLPIQDDPYWKVSPVFMDIHRIGRYIERFESIGDEYPQWLDDILEGYPTYYCVLGVHRGATADAIASAFAIRMDFPYYPQELLFEALVVMNTPELQAKYDEFLSLFEQYTKCLPPFEKRELIQKHTDEINRTKKMDRFVQIHEKYGDYCSLYFEGMPDLYEYAGLAKNSDIETIKRDCPNDSELLKKIYSILTTPGSRQEYDALMAFLTENGNPDGIENRKNKKKLWKEFDREMIEKIILLSLTEPVVIDRYFTRFDKILNENQDWREYIPPSKESFFSILGLDAGAFPADKKEIEALIRDKYRQLERTPRVNLAYSVLKNQLLRDDYLWIFENHSLLKILATLFHVERVHKTVPKGPIPHNPIEKIFSDPLSKMSGGRK
ncbi:MAG: hypothetical protein Q7U51_06800 [Methanoregula sp.]|nr:hypothetical protein [Methanoregula sp.]